MSENNPNSPKSSLTYAAYTIGIGSKTLRDHLIKEGAIEDVSYSGSVISINDDEVAYLKAKFQDSVPLSAVGGLLGVGGKIVKALMQQTLLPVWIKGGPDGEKHRYRILRSDLEAWVTELIEAQPLAEKLPSGSVLLKDAPLKTKAPINSIVESIRSGRVRVYGCFNGIPRFGGAILNLAEVIAVRPEDMTQKLGHWLGKTGSQSAVGTHRAKHDGDGRSPDLIRLPEIERLLGVGVRSVEKLSAAGFFGSKHNHKISRTQINEWVSSLSDGLRVLDETPPNAITIANAPRVYKANIVDLINAIHDRKVVAIGRLAGAAKFGGIILERSEVIKLIAEISALKSG